MSRSDRDVTRVVRSWLDEGVTALPDRVLDAVLDQLPATPQRRSWWTAWRRPNVNNFLRIGLAAAALVVVAVIGYQLLIAPNVAGPGPAPSESPAPTVTGPTNLMDSPREGDLRAGDYYLDLPAYAARIDFAVPAGWWHFYDAGSREDSTVHAILVNSLDTGAHNGSAWGLSFTVVDEVRVDPCDPSAGNMDSSVTESAEALAVAFSSWDAFPATGVEDVTLGGFSGKRVEMRRDESATCQGTLFVTPSGFEFQMELPSSEPIVNQFTFLDVEGSVLVIWTTDFPGTTLFEEEGGASPDPQAHIEDQGQLHDILESIVIQPR